MAWTVQVDREHRLVYVRMSEVVAFFDFAAMQDALHDDRDFDPQLPLLIDLRDADVRLTQGNMLSLAERTRLQPSTRIAILTNPAALIDHAREYEFIRQLLFGTDSVRACRSVEEAIEWLGVVDWRPPPQPHAVQAQRR
jgi:hypothetical protein